MFAPVFQLPVLSPVQRRSSSCWAVHLLFTLSRQVEHVLSVSGMASGDVTRCADINQSVHRMRTPCCSFGGGAAMRGLLLVMPAAQVCVLGFVSLVSCLLCQWVES